MRSICLSGRWDRYEKQWPKVLSAAFPFRTRTPPLSVTSSLFLVAGLAFSKNGRQKHVVSWSRVSHSKNLSTWKDIGRRCSSINRAAMARTIQHQRTSPELKYTSLLILLFSSAYFQIYNFSRRQLSNNTMIKDMIDKQVVELKKLWANKRQLLFQLLNLAMIVFSALMIWKGLMFLTKVRFDETL
jgi:hypothetical protein